MGCHSLCGKGPHPFLWAVSLVMHRKIRSGRLPNFCEIFIVYTTSCCGVLLEKLTISQLVKKFPASYKTQRLITPFTSARHLSLSSDRSIQSISPHPTSWRSILILSSHLNLGLPSGICPSGFPIKTLSSPPYVLHVPSISLLLIWSPK